MIKQIIIASSLLVFGCGSVADDQFDSTNDLSSEDVFWDAGLSDPVFWDVDLDDSRDCTVSVDCSLFPDPSNVLGCDRNMFMCYETIMCRDEYGEVISSTSKKIKPYASCTDVSYDLIKAVCCDEVCMPNESYGYYNNNYSDLCPVGRVISNCYNEKVLPDNCSRHSNSEVSVICCDWD